MLGKARIKPWEIREQMTIPEIALALDEDLESPRPPPGGQSFKSVAEGMAFMQWLRGLTPMERLRFERDGTVDGRRE